MTSTNVFEFRVGADGDNDLEVVSFAGREELSRPHVFDIRFRSRAHDLESKLAGEPAALVLNGKGGGARTIRGMIANVRVETYAATDERVFYSARFVSRLWSLKLSRESRIFQDLTVPQIVDAILGPRRIESRWKVARAYPEREYCVQYGESDLAFVSRLLAEEGIFYFVEPTDDGERVVFCDIPEHYEPLSAPEGIPLRENQGALQVGECLGKFSRVRAIAAERALVQGFDFRRPSSDLSHKTEAKLDGGTDPGRRIFDHDRDWDAWSVSDESVKVALESHRSRAWRGEGSGSSVRLRPGCVFGLEEHPIQDLNRRYAIVKIHHEGRTPEIANGPEGSSHQVYQNRFSCVPEEVPSRPRRKRSAHKQVLETATIVGPLGEEIHTDEHGRVKVQFHWDLHGKSDERSSCWVRTTQSWSGAAWGFQFIPRVGMEVVIGFLGASPDRPIILGAAYNGTHVPPYALPARKTESGVRTRSTPNSEGFNELRFEDAASKEQIFLHAQRNFDEVIGHDHSRHVTNDEVLKIGRTRQMDVDGDHVRTIKGNEVVTIHKNLLIHVLGRQHIVIDGQGASGDAEAGKPATNDAGGPKKEAGKEAPKAGARDSKASAAPAVVSFLAEQLPDELYDQGTTLRQKSEGMAALMGSFAEDREAANGAYASIVSAKPEDGSPLPAQSVELADALRKRAELSALGARQAVLAIAAELSKPPIDGPPALKELEDAFRAQLSEASHDAEGHAKNAALLQQMTGTIVESAGSVVPIPSGGGKARGGGGGDNVFSKDGDKSTLTINGGGIIDAPGGITIKCGGNQIVIDSGGVAINGAVIKLNC